MDKLMHLTSPLGKPIIIVASKVVAIIQGSNGTLVYVGGQEDDCFLVSESINTVLSTLPEMN